MLFSTVRFRISKGQGRPGRLVLPAIVLAAWLAFPAGGQGPEVKDTEMVHRQKYARQQFQKLLAGMLEAADLLAETEPESARAVRQAVRQAQGAFIAEDMERVVQLLGRGGLAPADRKQAEIIAELKTMLEILRAGALDVDQRAEQLAAWKRMLQDVRTLIGRQREHEYASRVADRGDGMAEKLRGLSERLQGIVARQKQLLAQTGNCQADRPTGPAGRVVALRRELLDLADSHKTLAEVTADLSVGQLPAAEKLQSDLARRTAETAEKLRAAAGQVAPVPGSKDGGELAAAGRAAGQAGEEMTLAADELGKGDKIDAGDRQQQSGADLAQAVAHLDEALKKLGAGSPFADLAHEQAALAGELRGLTDEVGRAAGEAAGVADEPDPKRLDRAAGHMNEAAEALQAERKARAQDAQRKALAELTDDLARLANLTRRLQQQVDRSDMARQEAGQDETKSQADKLAEEMKARAEADGAAAPGGQSLSEAASEMGQASKCLGGGQAGGANAHQNKALQELDKTRRELQEAVDQAQAQAQAEALVRIEERLRAVLAAQRRINAETADADRQCGDDEHDRAGQITCNQLADRQGAQGEQVDEVLDALREEGSTAVFPAVLAEIRVDMTNVQNLLSDLQTGPLTQSVQKEIAEALDQLVGALQKEMGRRDQTGGGGGGGGSGQEPLVPLMAELKMLRAMQTQVNGRTKALNRRRTTGGITEKVSRTQHKLLGDRQARIGRLTRELSEKTGASPTGEEGSSPEEAE